MFYVEPKQTKLCVLECWLLSFQSPKLKESAWYNKKNFSGKTHGTAFWGVPRTIIVLVSFSASKFSVQFLIFSFENWNWTLGLKNWTCKRFQTK